VEAASLQLEEHAVAHEKGMSGSTLKTM